MPKGYIRIAPEFMMTNFLKLEGYKLTNAALNRDYLLLEVEHDSIPAVDVGVRLPRLKLTYREACEVGHHYELESVDMEANNV